MIMMTLPGLSRKVGKVAQTCGLLPPSPPSTLEFSSIIGECPSDGYDGDEGSAEEGDQVTGNPISPRLGPPAYISRCWMGLVFQFFCKRTCLGVIYHIHIFKGIHEVWMPRTFQTRIVSGMHNRVSHFGVIFPNHSASGRDLCASQLRNKKNIGLICFMLVSSSDF